MKKLVYIICFLLLLILSNSCTIIGIIVGSIIDDIPKNNVYKTNEDLLRLSTGTDIKLVTIDNDSLEGKYLYTFYDYSSEYVREYDEQFDSVNSQVYIPKIKDTLIIRNSIGDQYKYEFLGFNYKSIFAKSILSGKEIFVDLNSIIDVTCLNDSILDISKLNSAFENKLIPMISKLNLETNNEQKSIYFHEIKLIKTESIRFKDWLIPVGATIDILIIFDILFNDRLRQ